MTNLKLANVYRLKLSNDGSSIVGDTIVYFQGLGRFRDIAISPDGSKIYVAADSVGFIKGAPGEAVVPPNKGCILEFAFATSGTFDSDLVSAVNLFPNPTVSGFTQLSLNLYKEAEVSIDLYAATGQKLATVLPLEKVKTIDKKLDMGQYQPGSYFLKIHIDGTTMLRKVIHF